MSTSTNSLLKSKFSILSLPLLDLSQIKQLKMNISSNYNQFSLPEEFIKAYKVVELIGKGFQAEVYKVINLKSHEILAAKIYKFKDEEEINQIKNEVLILKSIAHPSIISFRSFHSYPLDKTYILLTEYFPGRQLSDIISSLSSSSRPAFFSNIISLLFSVLSHLKKMSVVHWDLNCSNILYDPEENCIKVIDFGVAHHIDNNLFYSPEGNPKFRPPLNERDFNAFEVDFWGVWLVGIGILKGRVVGTKEVEKCGMMVEFLKEGWKSGFLEEK